MATTDWMPSSIAWESWNSCWWGWNARQWGEGPAVIGFLDESEPIQEYWHKDVGILDICDCLRPEYSAAALILCKVSGGVMSIPQVMFRLCSSKLKYLNMSWFVTSKKGHVKVIDFTFNSRPHYPLANQTLNHSHLFENVIIHVLCVRTFGIVLEEHLHFQNIPFFFPANNIVMMSPAVSTVSTTAIL